MDGPGTWIIVCSDFHGAVGPIPTEELAREVAAAASEVGRCNYRPVHLLLAVGSVSEPSNARQATRVVVRGS